MSDFELDGKTVTSSECNLEADIISSLNQLHDTSTTSEESNSSLSDLASPEMSNESKSLRFQQKGDLCDGLEESCKQMTEAVVSYLNGELTATVSDYQLLTKMNTLAADKYQEMSLSTNTLISKMVELNESYKLLQPYLIQIDLLEESVNTLEQTAYKLDSYSKQLETKFKKMEWK
ncbi:biogenesis of lysosome-related organelles complex 1 subunit 2 isoform X1 [Hydra vulgaris]|nr:biogenesis of lysosome-related organelles complex 1 subunit 2 [Hydra vulgaris]